MVTSAELFTVEWNLGKVAGLGFDREAITCALRAAGSDETGIQWG